MFNCGPPWKNLSSRLLIRSLALTRSWRKHILTYPIPIRNLILTEVQIRLQKILCMLNINRAPGLRPPLTKRTLSPLLYAQPAPSQSLSVVPYPDKYLLYSTSLSHVPWDLSCSSALVAGSLGLSWLSLKAPPQVLLATVSKTSL